MNRNTMKAVIFLGDKKLEIRDVPIPKVGPKQVLVQVKAAAICGSDVHFYTTKSENFTYPGTISGHEPAGIVVETGCEVANVKVGDRVTVYHFLGCGHCHHCHEGEYNLCPDRLGMGWGLDGSNAEYVLINAENCFVLPESLTMEDGTIIACIGATAYAALRRLEVSGRDVLAVYGLGALGLAALVIAKGMGATVIGVERNPYRLELAKKLGADYLVDTANSDLYTELMRITGGHGVDKGLEATGLNIMRKMSAKAAAIQGSIVMLGFDEDVRNEDVETLTEVDTRHLIRKELNIMGSYVISLGMIDEMLRFLHHKKVRLDSIVTHRFPMSRYQEALDLFFTNNAGKIIIEP